MDTWVARAKGLAIWGELESLGPVLNEAEESATRSMTSADDISSISRLRAMLSYIGKRMAGVDSFLVVPSVTDDVAGSLGEVRQLVAEYVNGSTGGELRQANEKIEDAVTHLSRLAVPATTEEFLGLKEAVDRQRQVVQEALEILDESFSDVRKSAKLATNEVREVSEALESKKTELISLVSGHDATFSEFINEKRKQFEQEREEWQGKSREQDDEHREKWEALVGDLENFGREAEQKRRAILEKLEKDFAEEANRLHSEMDKRREEIETLVGIIGNAGVTSGYLKASVLERKAARRWQLLTTGSLVFLAMFSIASFFNLGSVAFTWNSFSSRVLVTFTFGVLAAYAGRQGEQAQVRSNSNQELALKLAALGPFLAPLPEPQRHEMMIKMAERAFVREPPEGKTENHKRDVLGRHPVESNANKVVSQILDPP